AESEKIKSPDVEPGIAQRIPPGISIEAVGDGERGWKRRAVHVEHHRRMIRFLLRRQMAQEQLEPGPGTRDPIVLLVLVELRRGLLQHGSSSSMANAAP